MNGIVVMVVVFHAVDLGPIPDHSLIIVTFCFLFCFVFSTCFFLFSFFLSTVKGVIISFH